jgi:hypothetical protein
MVQALLLAEALTRADVRDADVLAGEWLARRETDGPDIAPFDAHIRGDADWWALVAPAHEVEAYFGAACRRLSGGGQAHLVTAAKRLLVHLWGFLPPGERAAFLARVDPEGRFVARPSARRGAAHGG